MCPLFLDILIDGECEDIAEQKEHRVYRNQSVHGGGEGDGFPNMKLCDQGKDCCGGQKEEGQDAPVLLWAFHFLLQEKDKEIGGS